MAECRNLIHQLIEPNPELRIPMNEVEVNPWITNSGKCPFVPYVAPVKNRTMRNQVCSYCKRYVYCCTKYDKQPKMRRSAWLPRVVGVHSELILKTVRFRVQWTLEPLERVSRRAIRTAGSKHMRRFGRFLTFDDFDL